MENLNFRGGTFCTTKAGLTNGTTTTYTTANTVLFAIGGKAYSKTAVTNGATPTTDATTGSSFTGVAASKGSVFVFCFNSSGTIKVSQGEVTDLDAGGNFKTAPEFPTIDTDTLCPFGYLIVKADSTASTWTFGSSNTSGATGLTYTWVDVMQLPVRPQTS
jgi:hypothetical protein